METDPRAEAAGTALTLSGPVRLADATLLLERARALAGAGPAVLEVDAAGAEHVHAAGLQILVALDKRLAASGRSLRIVNASGAARDALVLCGLDRWLLSPSPASPEAP